MSATIEPASHWVAIHFPAHDIAPVEAVQRGDYQRALQAFKKAYALSNKSSYDAALAMSVAYRGLGAHKSVFDIARL